MTEAIRRKGSNMILNRKLDRNSQQTLRAQITEILSAEFAQLPPGASLPSGTELRRRFQVAYMTITHALDDLVLRNEIVRIHGKGTFTATRGPRIIYCLIQSPDAVSGSAALLLNGALRRAHELDIRLVTHHVSLSGRSDEIDWPNMERLPEYAAVIVWGLWYHRIFDFLNQRHCRVAYIDPYNEIDGLALHKIEGFHRLVISRATAVDEAVRRLREAGRRRIFLYHHESHEDNTTRAGFRAALRKYDLEFSSKLELYSANTFNDAYQNFLSMATRGYVYDAVVAQKPVQALGCLQALRQQNIRVPEDISLVALEDDPQLAIHPVGISVIDSNLEGAGAEAVQTLAANPREPIAKQIDFKLINRHSI